MKRRVIQSLIEAQIEEWKTLSDDELVRIYNKEKNFGRVGHTLLLKAIMDERGIDSFKI